VIVEIISSNVQIIMYMKQMSGKIKLMADCPEGHHKEMSKVLSIRDVC